MFWGGLYGSDVGVGGGLYGSDVGVGGVFEADPLYLGLGISTGPITF